MGANPEKTELVIFTRKYKSPNLTLPKCKQAKYLGVILDKKLDWIDNILDRTPKAAIALIACLKAIGRKWGFSPIIVHGLYTEIVRPILLYGHIEWWPSLEKNCNLRIFHKIQRSAELCISGTTDNILGMCWDSRCAKFVFDLKLDRVDKDIVRGTKCPTKRQLLGLVISEYDPFGMLADLMIHGKILI